MIAQLCLYLWLGFLGGVAVFKLIDLAVYSKLVFIVLFCILAASLLARSKIILFCAVLSAGLILGNAYVSHKTIDNEYSQFIGQTIDWRGKIVISPDQVTRNQRLIITPENFSQSLQAYMYFPVYAKAGDTVWIRGQIALPENFDDFDYVSYLQNRNIYAQLKKPKVIVIERGPPSLNSVLTKLRFVLVKRSEQLFEGDSGSLIMGMLIGYRKTISEELQLALRQTGTTHIVAVSGFNMTIVAVSCTAFAWYIGRRATLLATVVAVICFAILTGGQASVVRAAVMALLVVYAQFSGRLYNSSYGLVWAAGLMVLHNPKILMGDIGFQLSLAATFGLLTAYRFKSLDSQSLGLSDILRSTLGATIMTAPLIAYYFGTISLLSLPVNMLILPLVPWVMLLGFLSLLPVVGVGFVSLADSLVKIIINVVFKFSNLPFSMISVTVNWQEIVLIYLLLIIFIAWKFQKSTQTN